MHFKLSDNILKERYLREEKYITVYDQFTPYYDSKYTFFTHYFMSKCYLYRKMRYAEILFKVRGTNSRTRSSTLQTSYRKEQIVKREARVARNFQSMVLIETI